MTKVRKIAMVVNKTTLADAEDVNILQWLKVPFEEKWKSLERLRKTAYAFYNKPYPDRVERVITIVK